MRILILLFLYMCVLALTDLVMMPEPIGRTAADVAHWVRVCALRNAASGRPETPTL